MATSGMTIKNNVLCDVDKNCTEVSIPDSVTSIGDCAFYGCSSLKSVTIPDSVTYIRYCAFDGCSSLESITIPDSVTSIGDWAFEGCSSLKSITIPDGVTSIGSGAFYACSSLKNIYIPDSVEKIGYSAFYGCNNCTALCEVASEPSGWASLPSAVIYGASSSDYEAYEAWDGFSKRLTGKKRIL